MSIIILPPSVLDYNSSLLAVSMALWYFSACALEHLGRDAPPLLLPVNYVVLLTIQVKSLLTSCLIMFGVFYLFFLGHSENSTWRGTFQWDYDGISGGSLYVLPSRVIFFLLLDFDVNKEIWLGRIRWVIYLMYGTLGVLPILIMCRFVGILDLDILLSRSK